MFLFGIEHELAFLNQNNVFADFTNAQHSDFQSIIDPLPSNQSEKNFLNGGTFGMKKKQFYVEGMPRLDEKGQLSSLVPKGIEIRTNVHNNIKDCIQELSDQYDLLCHAAQAQGFVPFATSFNPNLTTFENDPPMNEAEKYYYRTHLVRKNPFIYMLTFGPDLNISIPSWSKEKVLDFGKKLIFYSPYIIPFSFSPCLYAGQLWAGKSIRTFFRNGDRPAVQIYVENESELLNINPEPIKPARQPSEIGRIEFKTFDSCADFSLYAAFFALLKGLALDHSLKGRAVLPSRYSHKLAAKQGLESKRIFSMSQKLLLAAEKALESAEEIALLKPLKEKLAIPS
jgi:gamma-glutamyl:cysteine ligase YbdK (ATP-grasp superfamily)